MMDRQLGNVIIQLYRNCFDGERKKTGAHLKILMATNETQTTISTRKHRNSQIVYRRRVVHAGHQSQRTTDQFE